MKAECFFRHILCFVVRQSSGPHRVLRIVWFLRTGIYKVLLPSALKEHLTAWRPEYFGKFRIEVASEYKANGSCEWLNLGGGGFSPLQNLLNII